MNSLMILLPAPFASVFSMRDGDLESTHPGLVSSVMVTRWWFVLLVPLVLLAGCSSVHVPALSPNHQPTPGGLSQELQLAVGKLATDIGERNCYRTNSLEAAASWIEQQFTAAGLKACRLPVRVPAVKPFDCGAMTVWNIEAEKRGETRPNEIIVIGAHYDSKVATRSWLG